MLKELKLPGTDAAGVVGWGWSTVLIIFGQYLLLNKYENSKRFS